MSKDAKADLKPRELAIGWAILVGIVLSISTCVVSVSSDDDEEPEVAKEYYRSLEYAQSATKVCNAMNSTGLVTSCELDRERRVVQVYIPTYEPATMCWGSVAIITEATRELVGSGWRLRINDQECPLG